MQQISQGFGTTLRPSSLLPSSCSVLCWQWQLPAYQWAHFHYALLSIPKGYEKAHSISSHPMWHYVGQVPTEKCPFTWESLISGTHWRHHRLTWLGWGYCPDGLSWTHSFCPLRDVTRPALKSLCTCLCIFLSSQHQVKAILGIPQLCMVSSVLPGSITCTVINKSSHSMILRFYHTVSCWHLCRDTASWKELVTPTAHALQSWQVTL